MKIKYRRGGPFPFQKAFRAPATWIVLAVTLLLAGASFLFALSRPSGGSAPHNHLIFIIAANHVPDPILGRDYFSLDYSLDGACYAMTFETEDKLHDFLGYLRSVATVTGYVEEAQEIDVIPTR